MQIWVENISYEWLFWTPNKGSRDTVHAQPKNCRGPLCTDNTSQRPTYDIASIQGFFKGSV